MQKLLLMFQPIIFCVGGNTPSSFMIIDHIIKRNSGWKTELCENISSFISQRFYQEISPPVPSPSGLYSGEPNISEFKNKMHNNWYALNFVLFFMQGWSNPQTYWRELETQLTCPLILQMLAKVLDQESSEKTAQIIPFHPNINRNVQRILSTKTVFHPNCPYWIFLKSNF